MDHPQDLINRAYQLAWRSGSKGKLSKIELAELLVREGMPADLADQAATDTLLEVVKKKKQEGRQWLIYGLCVFGLGAVLMAASFMVLKTTIVLPIGIMCFGGALATFGFIRSLSDVP